MSPAMLSVLAKMMLAQAQECVFEQISLPGIRNEFFTLVKMAQEVAKVSHGTVKSTKSALFFLPNPSSKSLLQICIDIGNVLKR